MARMKPNKVLRSRVATAVTSLLLLAACGAEAVTQHNVDKPVGVVYQYGAPKNTEYMATLEPRKDVLEVVISEQSECDKIKVQLVERVVETKRGDTVVSKSPAAKVQLAEDPEESVTCERRFVREARAVLKVANAVYPLGTTNHEGRLSVGLSNLVGADVYGLPEGEASVFVQPQGAVGEVEVLTLTLAELQAHDQKVQELLAELEATLEGDGGAISQEQRTRAYQAYAKLRKVAWHDAHFEGLSMRFWELWHEGRSMSATRALSRNLEALNKAKELLEAQGAAVVPGYLRSGIGAGLMTERLLDWARWEWLSRLRGSPELCKGRRLPANAVVKSPLPTRIAFHYLEYVFGSELPQLSRRFCDRLGSG